MAMVNSPVHAKHLYYIAVEGSLNSVPISLHCLEKAGLAVWTIRCAALEYKTQQEHLNLQYISVKILIFLVWKALG